MPMTPEEHPQRARSRTDMGRANRVVLEVPVRLREGRSSFNGVTRNIGPGGVFVATIGPLGVGAKVILTLDLRDNAHLIEALAEVRWCRPFADLDDQPAGVGLRFIDTPLRAAKIASALRRSPPAAAATTARK
jgi:uncharacterized protein (TIGR02266 family)